MANRGDGRFDRHFLFGATSVQYVTWFSGTVIGALGGSALPDPEKLGLDAIYPAFFLALVPVAPAGIPVLAASVAALAGLRRRRSAP